MRWRISSTAAIGDDLHFQILGENGDKSHRFFAVAVSGGRLDLRRCRRGNLLPVCRARPLPRRRSLPRPVIAHVHSTYGTLPGELASPRTEDQTLSVDPFFQLTNDQVYASLTDTVAFEPPYVYPRSYDRTMWPTKGLCVADSVPTGVSFSPLDSKTYAFPPDLPLTDSGLYCVGIRPTPSGTPAMDDTGCLTSGYCPSVAQGRLATLPEVTDMHQTFIPPVEQSPVIYQIVLDLEIAGPRPVPAALQTIESLVDKYMHRADGAGGGSCRPSTSPPTPTRPAARPTAPSSAKGARCPTDGHGRCGLAGGLELPPDAPAVSLLLLQQPELPAAEAR